MKDFEPSVKKGLMFLRHEIQDLILNLERQNNIEGPLLRREHQLNPEKLQYWIEHIKGLEAKIKQ